MPINGEGSLMRSMKNYASLFTAGVLLATVAACSSGTSDVTDPTAEGGSGSVDTTQITVGYSGYTVSNPFFAGLLKGLENGAEETGLQLVTTNADGDPNQQVTDVQNLITQGVDYIAINPADGKAIGPAVKAAQDADIPVIALADTIEADVTFTISQDHVDAGRMATEEIVEFLETRHGKAEGKIVNIQGLSGSPAANGREEGFQEVLEEYPDIDVVATADGKWDTAESEKVMTTILRGNDDIDAVFAANGAEAVGVSRAIENAGLFKPVGEDGHIFVIGIDGPKPAVENIRNGIQDAEISQQPITMAEEMMRLVVRMANGEEITGFIEWPSQLLTRDNLDSEEVRDFGIWSDEV